MKSKCYVFSCYKQSNIVCLVYLESKLQQHWYALIHFKVKNLGHYTKKIFRDKRKTNKVLQMFFDIKVVTER